MLNRFKVAVATAFCAAASLALSFGSYAGGLEEYMKSYYNDYFDAATVVESAISVLEANPTGSQFYETGLVYNSRDDAYYAQCILTDYMSIPVNSSCRVVISREGANVYGTGFDLESRHTDIESYGGSDSRYSVFIGFAENSDHTEEIKRFRHQFEAIKQAAATIGGETEAEKIRNCMEYVVNMIDRYDASTPETHTIYNAVVNRTGCCEAYQASFFLLASLSGCRVGTVNLVNDYGDPHSLSFLRTDEGIRYIDCCWIDTKNKHKMEYFMFAKPNYDTWINDRARGV